MSGGQHLTFICPCGWGTKDSIRASNMKLRLHKKVCDVIGDLGNRSVQEILDSPVMKSNGFNGIKFSKRGNPQHIPLIANVINNGEIVKEYSLTEALGFFKK